MPARQSIRSCQTAAIFLLSLLPFPPPSTQRRNLYTGLHCDILEAARALMHYSQQEKHNRGKNISQQEVTRASKLTPQFSRGYRTYLAAFGKCQFSPKLPTSLPSNPVLLCIVIKWKEWNYTILPPMCWDKTHLYRLTLNPGKYFLPPCGTYFDLQKTRHGIAVSSILAFKSSEVIGAIGQNSIHRS